MITRPDGFSVNASLYCLIPHALNMPDSFFAPDPLFIVGEC